MKTTIIGKNPLQLSFGTALWSLPIVAAYIEREFDLVLHESTVCFGAPYWHTPVPLGWGTHER